MNTFLKTIVVIIVLGIIGTGGYFLGVKNTKNDQVKKDLENLNTDVELVQSIKRRHSDQISKIYSNEGFFVNEEEKADWGTYVNEDLGISFMVPKYCGEPEINKYYKRIDQTKIVQGTFSTDCPIKTFSAKMPDVNLENDDTSFGSYETSIKDSELNVTNSKGINAFIKHEYFFNEMGDGDTTRVYFTFNLKSSKYPVVTFTGETSNPFRKILNSIEIK